MFKTKLSTNKWIVLGIIAQLSILSILIYVPFMQQIFKTTALGVYDWAFLASLALIVVFAEEVRKFIARLSSMTREN
ncbi:MAG: cation transporting ATPase C-terminal domain-containing protein [Candidatus Bathyarchaeia archaeon]